MAEAAPAATDGAASGRAVDPLLKAMIDNTAEMPFADIVAMIRGARSPRIPLFRRATTYLTRDDNMSQVVAAMEPEGMLSYLDFNPAVIDAVATGEGPGEGWTLVAGEGATTVAGRGAYFLMRHEGERGWRFEVAMVDFAQRLKVHAEAEADGSDLYLAPAAIIDYAGLWKHLTGLGEGWEGAPASVERAVLLQAGYKRMCLGVEDATQEAVAAVLNVGDDSWSEVIQSEGILQPPVNRKMSGVGNLDRV
jgi:hypothetical protein